MGNNNQHCDEFSDKFINLMSKVVDSTGSVQILLDFNDSIMTYFFHEFFHEDYDIKDLDYDICNIGNMFLAQDTFNSLHKCLNNEDIELDVAVVVNDLEDFLIGNGV